MPQAPVVVGSVKIDKVSLVLGIGVAGGDIQIGNGQTANVDIGDRFPTSGNANAKLCGAWYTLNDNINDLNKFHRIDVNIHGNDVQLIVVATDQGQALLRIEVYAMFEV